nr:FG-GAP repeat protein [Acidobacteriota bacterium]
MINSKTLSRLLFGLSLFTLSLLAIVAVHRETIHSVTAAAADSPLLRGAAALDQLKQRGLYSSLQAAVQQARYEAERAQDPTSQTAAYRLHNPAQQLSAYFTPRGARLETDKVRFNLSPSSIGYGARRRLIAAGAVQATGERVEIARHLATIPEQETDPVSLTEWYVNRPAGLEHGFTLAAAPGKSRAGEPLALELSFTGNVRLEMATDQQGLSLLGKDGQEALQYAGLKVWDAKGKTLNSRLQLRNQTVVIEVNDTTATYPITIDPTFFTLEAQVLVAGKNQDSFGISVDLSGDTVVVGRLGSSAALVFVRAGNVWFLQQQLNSGELFDDFGRWVAVDGNTIAVTAIGISSRPGSKATYVYTRAAGLWTLQQKIPTADQLATSAGLPVAISGNTLVIGRDVYVRSGSVWTLQQSLRDEHGFPIVLVQSVAFDGNTIVIGLPAATVVSGSGEQGEVYIFTRSGSTWVRAPKLIAADGAGKDFFGTAVAVDGDVVVIGAPGDDIGANVEQGSAYVFARSGAAWTQQQKLAAGDAAANQFFGSAVAVSGTTIFVGAPYGRPLGSAYVFTRSTTWRQFQQLIS